MSNILTTSPWIWTSLLASMVALPILIHLINRLRHKRVQWAAMDFLMASHKRNKNRVWLKQLFLLLARIAVLTLLLFTIGQVGCDNDNLNRWAGGKTTHHYILVDDSFSMAEVSAGSSPMSNVRSTLNQIAERLAGEKNHRVTMIRFSKADAMSQAELESTEGQKANQQNMAEKDDEGNSNNLLADMESRVTDRDLPAAMQEIASRIEPSFLASGPETSFEYVSRLIEARDGENPIVYVLSDYRKKDWTDDDTTTQALSQLTNSSIGDVPVQLIRCTSTTHANLSITEVAAADTVRVAGIPVRFRVSVKNHGDQVARNVLVAIQSVAYPKKGNQTSIDLLQPILNELPEVLIEEIPVGETVSRTFAVLFPQQGQHAIRATLPDDALAADNQHWVVAPFATAQRVLLVTSPGNRNGRFASLALSPSGMTGLQIDLSDKSKLRDARNNELNQFESIFLLDVDQLDANSIRNLRSYVSQGGGVVFFLGPATNLKHYTDDLFDSGLGVFPLPLEKMIDVAATGDMPVADITATRHPIFEAFIDKTNSPLDLVQIRKVCQPPLEWSADDDPDVTVVATVRNQQRVPLVVEKRIGQGRVVAALTTVGDQWNNWMTNPTLPPVLLMMHNFASQGRFQPPHRLVGTSFETLVNAEQFQNVVTCVAATGPEYERTVWNIETTDESGSSTTVARINAANGQVNLPGVYETWLTDHQSQRQVQRFALNVEARESDLRLAELSELKSLAGSSTTRVVNSDNFSPGISNARDNSWLRWVLFLLIGLLIAEQLLAKSASFHSSKRKSGRRNSEYGTSSTHKRGTALR